MSIIKSFSVGDGDMFYIDHNSDNFTIIDCYLSELNDDQTKSILNEISTNSSKKGITRFISTHPDEDHIGGLKQLDGKIGIVNFYCVKNETTKSDPSDDFKKYCELRDADKAFYIFKGCSRKWMNESDEQRSASGIQILWPDTNNEDYKKELANAKNGYSPNNMSAIIEYSVEKSICALWMGDLETNMMEKIKDHVSWPEVDILFAPHHGRDSGKIPKEILDKLQPKVIIIGEAPSEHLNYYNGYNTITQNSAGDITFDCVTNKVHIYVDNNKYKVNFLNNENLASSTNCYYLGTLNV